MYNFIADIKWLIFEKQGMNALIQVSFIKQFIEINVNKVSRIPSKWIGLQKKARNNLGERSEPKIFDKNVLFYQV